MKVAIIGLGDRIASLLAPLKRATPEAKFVAVADPSKDRLNRVTSFGETPLWYSNSQEMLSADQYDLVMIGSPNAMHLDHARLALESDTPFIFLEKPVVTTHKQSFELAQLVAQHNGMARLLVGLVLRYAPLYRALRAAQDHGELGEVMSMEASEHIAPFHGSFFMRDWRRNTEMAGPFILEKCCHDIDLYQSVAGCRAQTVASFGGQKKFIPKNKPQKTPDYITEKLPRWGGISEAFSDDGDIVDYQTALIRFESGATLAFHTNLNAPDQSRRFSIFGVDAMAEGDFVRNHFKVTCSDSGEVLRASETIGSGSEDGHYGADEAMMRDIAAHMKDKDTPLPLSVKEALEAGLVALAIEQARMETRLIDLGQTWRDLDEILPG